MYLLKIRIYRDVTIKKINWTNSRLHVTLLQELTFNPPVKVLLALAFAACGGLLAGNVGGLIFKYLREKDVVVENANEAEIA